ncbi:MAG TPA: baseplate J/gp47 family protein, partial [Myxococcota bacterium]|nr:baseplate J/gp47 family protein [Myxococcota bacterium]
DPAFPAIVSRLLEHLRAGGLITDLAPGGVARLLMETFARELALLYQLLGAAHQAGYLDTARGPALDQVVALLGLTRVKAGRLSGEVLFTRATAAPQDIVIPAGLRVAGRPLRANIPAPLLEVVAVATLLRGTRSVMAAVQEIPGEETPTLDSVGPAGIHLMPQPLLGIEAVTNPEAITRVGVDEDDESLRARARVALRAGELATAEAIEAAARGQGAERVSVREPEGEPPGRVIVRIGDVGILQSPARWAALEAAVYRAKAAGVRVFFEKVQSVAVVPAIEVTPLDPSIGGYDEQVLRTSVGRALAAVVEGLPAGAMVSRRKLEGAVLALPEVRDSRLTMDTAFFKVTWADGEPVRGPADTATRSMGEPGWSMGELEQPMMDLKRWPPTISLRRESA